MELSTPQRKAVTKLCRHMGGPVWFRVGRGKTRTAYAWFAAIARRCANDRFLVVCRREAFNDWRDEKNKVGLKWVVREIECVDDIFQKRLSSKPIVYLLSHGMLPSQADEMARIAHMFDAVCFDEGYLYKNPSSLRCKAANKISTVVGNACILSGSIMTARNLTDVFGQLYAICHHDVLARTKTEFNSKFMFHLQLGDTGRGPMINRKGAVSQVARLIKPIASIWFPKKGQRTVMNEVKQIEPSRAQEKALEELRTTYSLALKGEELDIKNAPSLIIKCQQISDGWINMANPTPLNKKPAPKIVNIKSAKLEKLVAMVDELLACEERVVVWCAFKESVERVLQALQGFKGVYGMHGGRKFDQRGWKKDGKVAVITEASGSSFNHLRDCAYAIYYSMDVRWLNLQQSKGRTDREDSPHQTCYYWFMQTSRTLDAFVYKCAHISGKREVELLQRAAVKSWLNE